MNSAPDRQEIRLSGIGVSPGIAQGPAELLRTAFEEPDHVTVSPETAQDEKDRLTRAIATTRAEIASLQDQVAEGVDSEHAFIFESHLLLLEDAAVLEEVLRLIENEHFSADWAYYQVIKRYSDSLRKISDLYLRERAIDIEDVAQRVLGHLRRPHGGMGGVTLQSGTAIVLAHDLTPSDTVGFDRSRVLGFATEAGSPTSHTAIMARSLNIPAVVAIHEFPITCHPGDTVLIDGYHGLVIIHPSPATLEEYAKLSERESSVLTDLRALSDAPTLTADGRKIILSANIEFKKEIADLVDVGAEGVGLYRTEYFYLNEKELRGEEKQTEIYASVVKSIPRDGVIIRTLDIGGDKLAPELFDSPEPNPFLGWRGIRSSLDRVEEFKHQLRAILRASAHGEVGLMFPFVSNLEELRKARAILEECQAELQAAGVEFDEDIEVGVMIEIPSAALVADHLAKEVDFFSIGTNDLIQYTTAVDRVNDRVADLYRPTHPAVVQLLKKTVEAAHRNGIWCGVCGEAASDLIMTPIWVGLRVDELSVGSAQVLRTRRAISRLDTERCERALARIETCGLAADVTAICREIAEEAYPELLL